MGHPHYMSDEGRIPKVKPTLNDSKQDNDDKEEERDIK